MMLPIPYAFILEESTFVATGTTFRRCYDVTGSSKPYWLVTSWASTRLGVWKCVRTIIAWKKEGTCEP
jgi:hypothetical protein